MRRIFFAGLLAATFTSAVAAQSSERAADAERAYALISKAQQLDFVKDRQRIASLYEKASGFFSPSDPEAANTLNYAAQFYYAAGQKQRASTMLERAAQLATARGSAVEAAEFYIGAAITAGETREYAKRRRMVDNVLSLVANRDMTESDRIRILKRVVPPVYSDK
jgi:tetratricopeptide (TPR) repeat protein